MSKYILYKFYAPWCGPCRAMSNILDNNDQEFMNILKNIDCKFTEVNVDNDPDNLCLKYAIMSIPAFVLIKADDTLNKNTLWKYAGTISFKNLKSELEKYEN